MHRKSNETTTNSNDLDEVWRVGELHRRHVAPRRHARLTLVTRIRLCSSEMRRSSVYAHNQIHPKKSNDRPEKRRQRLAKDETTRTNSTIDTIPHRARSTRRRRCNRRARVARCCTPSSESSCCHARYSLRPRSVSASWRSVCSNRHSS